MEDNTKSLFKEGKEICKWGIRAGVGIYIYKQRNNRVLSNPPFVQRNEKKSIN
jgi:hypothetical protein